MIPPEHKADFVAAMENVLDVYKRPYDVSFPVICMDETPRQLIKERHQVIAATPGHPERHDYEYERCGVYNVFLANEPLAGKRLAKVTERKTMPDWAHFVRELAEQYPSAQKITLVMDNLNTHKPGALYEAFDPPQAKRLWDRFEFIYTPKHGSWLNMAEIELNVLMHQCLDARMGSLTEVATAVAAWQSHRNNRNAKIDWQFTTQDARVKLLRLYPTEHV